MFNEATILQEFLTSSDLEIPVHNVKIVHPLLLLSSPCLIKYEPKASSKQVPIFERVHDKLVPSTNYFSHDRQGMRKIVAICLYASI